MAGVTDYGTFCLAVLLFLMLPGPGTFTLLTATGKGGFRAGAAATFGIIAGDQVLMWLALGGVAALLSTYPQVFKGVQYLGAAYLAWIGLRLIFTRPGSTQVIDLRPGHYFRQTVLITLLNPKAIVFYMAFLPPFIDPHRQSVITFLVLAGTIASLTLVYCLTLCALSNAVAEKVRAHRRMAGWLQRLAGVFLLGFGWRLGTQ
jgi:threonine/homoserine/homoserine lactone efflux protein